MFLAPTDLSSEVILLDQPETVHQCQEDPRRRRGRHALHLGEGLMLLTLGRGLAPAGRGEGVEAPPLRLTDLVPGLTANWEVFNESLLDTTP